MIFGVRNGLLSVFLLASPMLYGDIPEPSNLVYGKINIGGVSAVPGGVPLTITAKLAGQVIASYQFGSNQGLEDNYLLSIPLDSEGDREQGTAREGDLVELYISNVFVKSIRVGPRGTLLPTDLPVDLITYQSLDTDGDGIPDYIETQLSYLDENKAEDAGADEDGDGYSNLEEYLANTDPQDPDSQPFLTDYTMSITMSTETDGELGVMFRYQGPDNYYRFSWSNKDGSRRLEKNVEGNLSVMLEDNAVLSALTDHRVDLSIVGENIKVSVNDSDVFTITDSSFDKGTIALYNRDSADSKYDNLVLTNLKINRKIDEHFSVASVLDQFTIVDEGGVGTVSTWSITDKYLTQTTQIFNTDTLTEGSHGTFAIFQLNDSDSDGVPNESDVFPIDANAALDTDSDGMPDTWELDHGFNPHEADDESSDADGDGVSNVDEYKNNTDPNTYNVNEVTPESRATTTAYTRQVSSISMMDSSSFATTSAIDPFVKVWDTNGDLTEEKVSFDTKAINGIHSSASYLDEVIVGTGDATVQVWDTNSNQKKYEFDSMSGSVLAVDVSDSYYTAGTAEGMVYLWNKQGEFLTKWNTGGLFISDIKIHDGLVYVNTSLPNETTAWDLTGNLHYLVEGGDGAGYPELDISSEGTLVIAGSKSRKGIVKLRSAPAIMGAKAETEVLTVYENPLSGLYINKSNQQMISGDEKGNIYISQLPSGQLLRVFNAHEYAVTSATLTDTTVISASVNGEIKVWNLD